MRQVLEFAGFQYFDFLLGILQHPVAKLEQFGAALGLPAEQLASVTKSISLEFNNGNTQEEIRAALMGALEGYGNALVDGWATAIAPRITSSMPGLTTFLP